MPELILTSVTALENCMDNKKSMDVHGLLEIKDIPSHSKSKIFEKSMKVHGQY